MTVLTLIKIGEHYGVLADRGGAVQADHSMESALAKYKTPGVISTSNIINTAHHRLYEIEGNFLEATQVLAACVEDMKLYRHQNVLYQVVWVYKLKPDIGVEWYQKATPAIS